MDIHKTYQQLCTAYSDENMNRIAGTLINLYKSKRFGAFREIANRISPYVAFPEEKEAKLFPKLIGLYHPDRATLIRKELEAAYAFWLALKNQQNASGGPFESTPANAPGNISNGAIGFFGASAVSVGTGTSR